MLLLRFVLDLPPAQIAPLTDAATRPEATADSDVDLLAFDAPAAFADWSDVLLRSPYLRERPWGSAFIDDPWPPRLPKELHPALTQELQARYSQQAVGAPHSLSFLTVDSQCRVRLEAHEAALALDVAIPTTQGSDGGGLALPRDVAALLQPLPLLQEADLLSALDPLNSTPDSTDTTALLLARQALQRLGALWHDDLRLLDVLRLYADHPLPGVRGSVIAVASHVGYRLFLLERAACETDALLRRVLRTVTAWTTEGTAAPATPQGAA